MPPTESDIAAAIDRLSPALFEQLACRWVCDAEEYSGRFAGLEITGRREGVIMPKWPDGVIIGPRGEMDCVEATRAVDWKKHLDGDIEWIRSEPVRGFVFISWCQAPEPQQIRDAKERIVAAGVPAENVDLVFRGRLLHSLRKNWFAHLWRDPLRLNFVPLPFRQVDTERGLIGIDAGSEELHPRPAEFRTPRQVHEPRILPAVHSRLESEGFVQVYGHGAAGKTVLAEHVIQRHLLDGAIPLIYEPQDDDDAETEAKRLPRHTAYYCKLDPLSRHSQRDLVEVFLQNAAANALFVIDDTHLEPQAALDLRNQWEDLGKGSKMLQLGRRKVLDHSRGVSVPDDSLELSVGSGDLKGVFRRLASLRRGGAEPPSPPSSAVKQWLELFRGDLVVFTAAASAALERQLADPDEWELTVADAAHKVKKRYLPDSLSDGERRDLLSLAVLAEYEVGVPVASMRTDLPDSVERGAVLHVRFSPGEAGEFRLAHPGLGRLLLAVNGEEQRDFDELLHWARQDVATAVWIGLHMWRRGENDRAESLWEVAVTRGDDFGQSLLSLPTDGIESVIEGLDTLGILSHEELDRRLASEMEKIARRLLDRPAGLGRALAILSRYCPNAGARLHTEVTEPVALDVLLLGLSGLPHGAAGHRIDELLRGDPSMASALGSRLAEPEAAMPLLRTLLAPSSLFGCKPMARVLRTMPEHNPRLNRALTDEPAVVAGVTGRLLDGPLTNLPRAGRAFARLAEPLGAELQRRLKSKAVQTSLATRARALEPTNLLGLIRFAQEVSPGLTTTIESSIAEGERVALAEKLLANRPVLQGFFYSAEASPLVAEIAERARALGAEMPRRVDPRGSIARRLEEDPSQALMMNLGSVLGFVASDHEGELRRQAVNEALSQLRSPENADRLIGMATQLAPAGLRYFLDWSATEAPQLHRSALRRLEDDSVLAQVADSAVDCGSFDEITGLLDRMDAAAPEAGRRLQAALVVPQRTSRLVEAGLRGTPSGWSALLERDTIAIACLESLDLRRWRQYWRRRFSGSPHWLLGIEMLLGRQKRSELQSAPAEAVIRLTTREDWLGGGMLGSLGSAIAHGGGLGEEAIFEFLTRIDHIALLDREYEREGTWRLAHFLSAVGPRTFSAVFDTLLTAKFALRVQTEMRIPWSSRNPASTAGFLGLCGALRLASIPFFASPPPASSAAAALESIRTPGGRSTAGHVLVWCGLLALVDDSETPLQLPPSPALTEQLGLLRTAEPPNQQSSVRNSWLLSRLEEAATNGWRVAPNGAAWIAWR